MFCQNCGTQNADSSKFCKGCGTSLWDTQFINSAPMGGNSSSNKKMIIIVLLLIMASASLFEYDQYVKSKEQKQLLEEMAFQKKSMLAKVAEFKADASSVDAACISWCQTGTLPYIDTSRYHTLIDFDGDCGCNFSIKSFHSFTINPKEDTISCTASISPNGTIFSGTGC